MGWTTLSTGAGSRIAGRNVVLHIVSESKRHLIAVTSITLCFCWWGQSLHFLVTSCHGKRGSRAGVSEQARVLLERYPRQVPAT